MRTCTVCYMCRRLLCCSNEAPSTLNLIDIHSEESLRMCRVVALVMLCRMQQQPNYMELLSHPCDTVAIHPCAQA